MSGSHEQFCIKLERRDEHSPKNTSSLFIMTQKKSHYEDGDASSSIEQLRSAFSL